MIVGLAIGVLLMCPVSFVLMVGVENYWLNKLRRIEDKNSDRVGLLIKELTVNRKDLAKFKDLCEILSIEYRNFTIEMLDGVRGANSEMDKFSHIVQGLKETSKKGTPLDHDES